MVHRPFDAVFKILCVGVEQRASGFSNFSAGTGLLFILRWFWYRINAYSEITAMIVFFLAIYFQVLHTRFAFSYRQRLAVSSEVCLTTLAWVAVTLLTALMSENLDAFCSENSTGGPGWAKVREQMQSGRAYCKGLDYSYRNIMHVGGAFAIYSALFSTGYFIYEKQEQDCFLPPLPTQFSPSFGVCRRKL